MRNEQTTTIYDYGKAVNSKSVDSADSPPSPLPHVYTQLRILPGKVRASDDRGKYEAYHHEAQGLASEYRKPVENEEGTQYSGNRASGKRDHNATGG